MYGTKYFPNEVCITGDIDMIMFNKQYFVDEIEHYSNDDLESTETDKQIYEFISPLLIKNHIYLLHTEKYKDMLNALQQLEPNIINSKYSNFIQNIHKLLTVSCEYLNYNWCRTDRKSVV